MYYVVIITIVSTNDENLISVAIIKAIKNATAILFELFLSNLLSLVFVVSGTVEPNFISLKIVQICVAV